MYNLQGLLLLRAAGRLISFYLDIIMNIDLNSKGMVSRSMFAFL